MKYRVNDGRRFIINGIYSYQFNSDVIDFIKDNECLTKEYNQIEDIIFEPMIELFQHYSSIFIILNNQKTKHTKKMYNNILSNKRKTVSIKQ
jgi:uncharacterized protein YhbP (UPF0306 family)